MSTITTMQCEIPVEGTQLLVAAQGRWNAIVRVHEVEVALEDSSKVLNWYFTDVRIIRNWGTTNGIGELVPGPTPRTRIDKIPGIVCMPHHSVIWWTQAGAGWK